VGDLLVMHSDVTTDAHQRCDKQSGLVRERRPDLSPGVVSCGLEETDSSLRAMMGSKVDTLSSFPSQYPVPAPCFLSSLTVPLQSTNQRTV
jgi:hypothetical protein